MIGLGGMQGTATGTTVMRALPYGLPKVMVSTVAAGDTSPYVGIKDITMMFSVSDILGLNPFMRKVLANAAGAARGMAQVKVELAKKRQKGDKPLIGMTNLGVLTQGTLHALALFAQARLRGDRVPRRRRRRPRDGADDARRASSAPCSTTRSARSATSCSTASAPAARSG